MVKKIHWCIISKRRRYAWLMWHSL